MKAWLVISVLIFLLVCSLLFFKESADVADAAAAAADIAYFRITDALDYNKPSMVALQPFVDLGLTPATTWDSASLIMFETLNLIDRIMPKIAFPTSTKFIFGLGGSDMLASKSMLAVLTRDAGKVGADLIPPTYVTDGGLDRHAFFRDYDPTKIYILKKNIQRQQGFVITRDRHVLESAFDGSSEESFVVCQELLQDPLVIVGADGVGRKINLRIYILVVVTRFGVNIYMYDDGFIYYTAEAWVKGSLEKGPNITTGYVDRQVYADNPLTVKDLESFLGPDDAAKLRANIKHTMERLAHIYKPIFWDKNRMYPGTKFLIYGCDLAPSSDFKVKIMEVNKGPDLGYKDERDKALKLGMMANALRTCGAAATATATSNIFIRL